MNIFLSTRTNFCVRIAPLCALYTPRVMRCLTLESIGRIVYVAKKKWKLLLEWKLVV